MKWLQKIGKSSVRIFHFVFTFMVSPKSVLDHEFGPIDEDERFKNAPAKPAAQSKPADREN